MKWFLQSRFQLLVIIWIEEVEQVELINLAKKEEVEEELVIYTINSKKISTSKKEKITDQLKEKLLLNNQKNHKNQKALLLMNISKTRALKLI